MSKFSLRLIHPFILILPPRLIPDLYTYLYTFVNLEVIFIYIDYFSQYETLDVGLQGGEVC